MYIEPVLLLSMYIEEALQHFKGLNHINIYWTNWFEKTLQLFWTKTFVKYQKKVEKVKFPES